LVALPGLLSWLAQALLAAGLTLGVLAALYVPLEKTFPARAQRLWRRDSRVDLAFFWGQQLVFQGLSLQLLLWALPFVQAAVPAAPQRLMATLPLPAQALVVVVLGDLLTYWFHRACHHVPLLWRFHRVHHTSEQLDFLAAFREHPFDGLVTQLMQNLPGIVLGAPLSLLAPLSMFRGLWAGLIHCNVTLPLGPLGLVLGDPLLHRAHHAVVDKGVATRNFGNLSPYWDLVFGTHHRPPHEAYPLGVSEPHPRAYAALLLDPFLSRTRRDP
jgi:sterol desaturase/sphingolipid hydroxylase (fatty acid hydroxylase superfamily)